jgi:hypothetical protein
MHYAMPQGNTTTCVGLEVLHIDSLGSGKQLHNVNVVLKGRFVKLSELRMELEHDRTAGQLILQA